MYISKSFAVLEHNVTFNIIVSRYKIIYVEIRMKLRKISFPTHQHNNIGNHIVVPGVMNSLGLSKQPMKLALLNLVPPVPYTYTNIFDDFISNIF